MTADEHHEDEQDVAAALLDRASFAASTGTARTAAAAATAALEPIVTPVTVPAVGAAELGEAVREVADGVGPALAIPCAQDASDPGTQPRPNR